MEHTTNCPQCANHCSLDALQCGRGRKYLESLQSKEQSLGGEVDANRTEEQADHEQMHGRGRHRGIDHRHGGERHREMKHGHGKGFGHGRHQYDYEENSDDLYGLLRVCGHMLYRQGGERNGQGRIISILSKYEEIGQKELQEMLQIQPGSMSEILSKMENRGLIERIKDEEDKRKTIVRLTEEAKVHVQEHRKSQKKRDLFAALDEQQQDELKKMLKLLLSDWRKEQEEEE